MRRLPPLNALRVFDAAANCLSFSAAAEELCVTHSAVSQQIRQLEEWLGTPVFVRHASGVRLTANGQTLHAATAHAMGLLERSCAEIAGSKDAAELVLGAPGSFLANWLIPRLANFELAHPEIRVHLQTSASLDELEKRRVDMLIVSGRAWPSHVSAKPLFEDKAGPVCAPERSGELHVPSDLVGKPLLHTKSYLRAWPEWAQLHGLDPKKFEAGRQFDHLPLMLEAAAAGLGFAIAPELLTEREIESRRLMAPLGFYSRGAVFACCTALERQDDKALLALRGWLGSEAAAGYKSPDRARNA